MERSDDPSVGPPQGVVRERPMTPRTIAFVQFAPSGGLFQFTAQLGEALAARGNEVHLFTGPDPELTAHHRRFRIHGVLPTWHPMDASTPGPLRRSLRRAFRAVRLGLAWAVVLVRLARLRPDAVLWSTWPFSIDALGVLVADVVLRHTMLGIVAHEPVPTRRSDTTSRKTGPVLDWALPAAWRRMDVVFVLGDEARDRCLAAWQPRGPVLVVPHGDEAAMRDDRPTPPASATDPVVLFFGTWTAYKGIDVLLDSFPEVRRRVPAARVVLAGGVAGIDLTALQSRAAAIPGVELRPGYIDREQVPVLFRQARVVVTPYRRASQSGVVHLAYTFDRPVVASAVGDIPLVVRDGETGLLVEPGDPSALAEALVTLLLDPECARRLGEAGAAWLATESSWDRVAELVGSGLDQAALPRR